MAMGRRPQHQQADLFVTSADLPRSPGHASYDELNTLLANADGRGRDPMPPGVYFRTLFVGSFEALGSQRAFAWRCSDRLSLRAFLGVPLTEPTPDHSRLTRIRHRLPLGVYERVFIQVLQVVPDKRLLRGRTVVADIIALEANVPPRGIVRKEGRRRTRGRAGSRCGGRW